uniref:Uncharacterized protein n=1 Tax=Oryza sativa subsp. japonica TaxID=39947 RepID=Q6K5M0_ORYSJ|nr:hypothetical protein [Oryza sativa Japonica Group]BAD22105.1 hypothetical protein [Oryza sativa Japonica Group]
MKGRVRVLMHCAVAGKQYTGSANSKTICIKIDRESETTGIGRVAAASPSAGVCASGRLARSSTGLVVNYCAASVALWLTWVAVRWRLGTTEASVPRSLAWCVSPKQRRLVCRNGQSGVSTSCHGTFTVEADGERERGRDGCLRHTPPSLRRAGKTGRRGREGARTLPTPSSPSTRHREGAVAAISTAPRRRRAVPARREGKQRRACGLKKKMG